MKPATLFSLVLIAAGSRPAPAAEPGVRMTLAQCLARLDAQHPVIAAGAADVAKAEAERRATAGLALPSISAMALAGPTPAAHGNAIQTTTPVTDYGGLLSSLGPFFKAELSITQPVYTFGKIGKATRARAEAVEVQRAKSDVARWELVGQVKSLYYGTLLLTQLVSLLDDVEGKVKQARTYVDEQLAAGTGDVSDLDRLRLAAYASEVQLQRIEVDRRLAVTRDGLARLLLLDPATPVVPADERLEPIATPIGSLDMLVQTALGHEPELAEAEHGARALEAKAAALRARFLPDLFVAGGIRYGVAPNRDRQRSPFAVDSFNYFDGGIAAGLRWKWDVGVTGPEADAASAELAALRERLRALRERVRHDVFAAYTDAREGRRAVDVATDAYRTGRTWVSMAYERFELGTASAKDLVDGLAGFVKARYTYLQSAFDYNVTVAKLSAAVGEELQPELARAAHQE